VRTKKLWKLVEL
jgi:hypothetical protein